MIVLLKLTTAGSDTGPFDLYSNLNGYTTAFETGVDKVTLTSGYSTTVPDGATIVKIKSTGDCISFTYITLRLAECNLNGYVEEVTTPTTTTTSSSSSTSTSTSTSTTSTTSTTTTATPLCDIDGYVQQT